MKANGVELGDAVGLAAPEPQPITEMMPAMPEMPEPPQPITDMMPAMPEIKVAQETALSDANMIEHLLDIFKKAGVEKVEVFQPGPGVEPLVSMLSIDPTDSQEAGDE